jgi:manganese-dependent inorganic pyrophosphatase
VKIYVVGHVNPDTDSVCSAIAYAHFLHTRHVSGTTRARKVEVVAARAGNLNPETRFVLNRFKHKTPELITSAVGKHMILVDHNEIAQAVPGMKKAVILEIIDHHRIGDVETIHPIPFENEPRGSTCSIIADRYSWYRVKISKKIAGLLLSGILSDTLLLKSPTTTRKDKEWARKLANMARVRLEPYGRRLLQAGCSLIRKTPRVIVNTDCKTYHMGRKGVSIAQVYVANTKRALEKRKVLLQEMQKELKKKRVDYFFLMITNVVSHQTDLLVVAKHEKDYAKVNKHFHKQIHNNTIILPKIVSRKKQVQPRVLKLMG